MSAPATSQARGGAAHGLCAFARLLPAALIAAAVLTSPVRGQDGGRSIAEGGSGGGAPACSSCHGQQGEGQPDSGFPRLSGLDRGYLTHQLDSFASGGRKNEIMGPIASALTPEERSAVAAFYAGLSAAGAQTKPSSQSVSAGGQLARLGEWSNGVPPCISCHGPTGAGVGGVFPALAGQNATYIANQLNAWRNGERANDPMGLMAAVAKRLTERQIEEVAAFFETLTPTRPGATP
ncbi:cytochrome c [Alsobacter soli]|uniref:Cytochrome c n=1 Tax=Alsobacter soli TaxID=2109933 RepID=A0A2T1HLF6_9HYPH|nr:c-type cytochrome [Alsobacter soli]PSC02487.1 cytochrome c [Alsobacter soli]